MSKLHYIKIWLTGLLFLFLWSCGDNQRNDFLEDALRYCTCQTERSLDELEMGSVTDYSMMPHNILKNENRWNCRKATQEEWTSGFWPGILWYNYEYTHDEKIKSKAEKYTQTLSFLSSTPAFDHDLGYLVLCSFGNGYRLTGNPQYLKVILDAADSLATLFNPKVGSILSWPREVKKKSWPHNTIISNMINLEILFWAAKNGDNKNLYDIALSHADLTMKHHFKGDFTCCQVAVYDTVTGCLINRVTHQGFGNMTMWARGQSWAIYGYTVCYRETNDPKYLDFVQKITDIYLSKLPEDLIPYWDFSAPDIPNAPRDASAAAITASALLELSDYVNDKKSQYYIDMAVKMLHSLHKSYQSNEKNPSFLLHSTGHWPNSLEIDASIIYADYYYLEALIRLKKLREKGLNL